jgi:hypothetical protein
MAADSLVCIRAARDNQTLAAGPLLHFRAACDEELTEP